MTPDPVLEKLVRFTPSAPEIDTAEILFRAGRASARTHGGWKLAVAGLLLANIALGVFVAMREATPPSSPLIVPVFVVLPMAVPSHEADFSPNTADSASQWRFGAMLRTTDPNDLPQSSVLVGPSPSDPPLTPRSRGEID